MFDIATGVPERTQNHQPGRSRASIPARQPASVAIVTQSAESPPAPVQQVPLRTPHVAKRVLDLSGATMALFITAPIMVAVAFLVRATSPGPTLDRTRRIGRDGTPYTDYRFRTTHQSTHTTAAARDLSRHLDVTPLGRTLRRYRLDALPALINVMNGTMSLVGPQPPTPTEFRAQTTQQQQRLIVKPGLVSIWEAAGRSDIHPDRRTTMDLTYSQHHSPRLDLNILFRALPTIISGQFPH